MNRTWMACLLISTILVLPQVSAFAQTETPDENSAARKAAAAATAKRQEQARKDQEKLLKSQQSAGEFRTNPRNAPGTGTGPQYGLVGFRVAIPKFRDATDQYRWAMSMDQKLDKTLKNIETQTDALLRYLDTSKMKHPRVDASEFKDYSPVELQWETLNSAERIAAYLDFAVAAERMEVVSLKTLEFLYVLDGELLRLKWLTTHTNQRPALKR